jgi:hypothetical protein
MPDSSLGELFITVQFRLLTSSGSGSISRPQKAVKKKKNVQDLVFLMLIEAALFPRIVSSHL